MKGNIKKLAVFVIIATIAMFTAVAMAWDKGHDGDHWKHFIWGKYAVTGSGNNLVSTTGFDKDYNPNPCPPTPPPFGCVVFQDIEIFSGSLTFNKDGTGHFKQINRGIDTPPLAYSLKAGDYDFIYTMTSERTFTYQLTPGTYFQVVFLAGGQTGQTTNFVGDGYCEGVFSQDFQNVIVTCGPTTSPPDFTMTAVDPSGNKLPIQAILSQSVVGIAVNE